MTVTSIGEIKMSGVGTVTPPKDEQPASQAAESPEFSPTPMSEE